MTMTLQNSSTKGNEQLSTTNAPFCTVCKKNKYNLRARKSKLIPNMQMFLCNECFDGKFEPRFAIILVARDPNRGLAVVRDYIRNHRYFGDKILAKELV